MNPNTIGTSPGTYGSNSLGSNNVSNSNNVDVDALLKLVKTDQDFRNDLKAVIVEALKPELDKLKDELLVSHRKKQLDSDEIIKREFPGASLEKWSHMDEQATVYGFKEMVNVDLIRYNNISYICCIKQSIDVADVVYLIKIGKFYRSLNPKNGLSCVIISPNISQSAKNLATKCKMRTIEE